MTRQSNCCRWHKKMDQMKCFRREKSAPLSSMLADALWWKGVELASVPYIARGFSMMESIRVIVVNSATANCFVERRNGDGEGREIGVEIWRSIRRRGSSGRQRMLPPALGCFGYLAGILFRALLAHHPTILQSSHFYS
jgi:hypothetical protein